MRILHTADLHLGQILYQNYDRIEEHEHFFTQLEQWCVEYRPDALVVAGDLFDIQQPSAATKKRFTDCFVALHDRCPDMAMVFIAGNHDSASRIHADSAVWRKINAHLIGMPPTHEMLLQPDGWQRNFIVELPQGFLVAMPFIPTVFPDIAQSLLNYVNDLNKADKPVVMMAHLAITGMDCTGHDFEVGKVKTQDLDELGTGYDYLALGHIHRPQTLGYLADEFDSISTYPAGIARYSGSALHVSCDEKYPHSVSLVDIDRHGGEVTLHRLRIEELLHFYELPLDGSSANTAEEALDAVRQLVQDGTHGYFRLRISNSAPLPADFGQSVYDLLRPVENRLRYNPNTIWTGRTESLSLVKPIFEIADLQQMTDPMEFIEETMDHYPDLDLEDLRLAFEEVKEEMRIMNEETSKYTKTP